MKKTVIFALMIALLVSMAVPAAAATASATADATDLQPVVVSSTCEDLTIYTTENLADMPEEAQKAMLEAKEKLAVATPAGMAARYFFYVDICDQCSEASITFALGEYTEIVFMQYVDGEWVELEYTINADGTITVNKIVDGPVVIFVK